MWDEDDFTKLYDFLRSRERFFALEEYDREQFEQLLKIEMETLWNEIHQKELIKESELNCVKRIVWSFFNAYEHRWATYPFIFSDEDPHSTEGQMFTRWVKTYTAWSGEAEQAHLSTIVYERFDKLRTTVDESLHKSFVKDFFIILKPSKDNGMRSGKFQIHLADKNIDLLELELDLPENEYVTYHEGLYKKAENIENMFNVLTTDLSIDTPYTVKVKITEDKSVDLSLTVRNGIKECISSELIPKSYFYGFTFVFLDLTNFSSYEFHPPITQTPVVSLVVYWKGSPDLNLRRKLKLIQDRIAVDFGEPILALVNEIQRQALTETATRAAVAAIMARNKAHHQDSHIRPRIGLEDVLKRLRELNGGSTP